MSSIKAFYPGDIIVVDELSVDGNLYIWHKRQRDVPKKYREEVVAFLDNYACNQGVYAYEIVWEPEMTWQDSARITITVNPVNGVAKTRHIKSINAEVRIFLIFKRNRLLCYVKKVFHIVLLQKIAFSNVIKIKNNKKNF